MLLSDTAQPTSSTIRNAGGTLVNPATAEGIGSAGSSPPSLPGNGSGVIGWLRKVYDTLASGIGVTPAATEAHLGQVGGDSAVPEGVLTRLANTTAYASGQLIGNNAVAASVTPIEVLLVARKNGGSGRLSRIRVTREKNEAAAVRIHAFRTAPTVVNGDGGAFKIASPSGYLGSFDATLDASIFNAGARGFAVPSVGGFITFVCEDASQKLYLLLEARGVVTPTSGEKFTIGIEVDRD